MQQRKHEGLQVHVSGHEGGKLMYDELVKRLREHGEFLIVSDRMKAPPNVNVRNVFAEDYAQAADAIEELQATLCNWCAVCPRDKRDLSTCEIYESCRANPPKGEK